MHLSTKSLVRILPSEFYLVKTGGKGDESHTQDFIEKYYRISKRKENTPKQPTFLWVNRRKNPQVVISDSRHVGMSVPCRSPFCFFFVIVCLKT